MFQVKLMSTADFEFAVRITDMMDWGLVEEDFHFMTKLEPKGCFVLLQESERVGIATTISFRRVGWLGNVIIGKSYRKKGAGKLLVKHCLSYLRNKNVKTVGLYSYLDTVDLYKKLGFEYESEFIVMRGKGFSSSVNVNLKEARKGDIQALIDYDHSCFGASRRRLLEPLLLDSGNLCYLYSREDRILGFGMAKVYEGIAELGPIVCEQDHKDVANSLLGAILNRLQGFEISLCISQKEYDIVHMLMQYGFSEKFRVARMFLGPQVVKDCVYVAESLERG